MNPEQPLNPRQPSWIMKEIKKVSQLIRDNNGLMDKYPEEVGLELDQWALESRKSDLLIELKKLNDYFKILMFDLTLEDNEFSNLSLDKVGSFFTSLQKLVTSLVQSIAGPVKKGAKVSDAIREISRLEIIDGNPGSLNIVLKEKTEASVTDTLSKEAFNRLNFLFFCGDDRELIMDQLGKLGNKPIGSYKEFLNVIIKNNIDLKLYDNIKPEGYETFSLTNEFANKVYSVIIETTPTTETEIIEGLLGAIDTFSKKFTIKKPDETIDNAIVEGKKVSLKYGEDYAVLIKNKLESNVKIEVSFTKDCHELEDEIKDKDWTLMRIIK